MKRRRKRILVAALATFAALAFVGTALAVPMLDGGGSASASIAVRPDDRTGVRGPVLHAQLSQSFSQSPSARGERSFGGYELVQVQPASTGSSYDWNKTIGISAGSVALALCLAGLGIVGMRQRKVRLSV
jgi:hypothetical protein